jgi:uncharacterized membrane protein YjgN (DUF898 family)
VALAVLIPINILYFLLGLAAEETKAFLSIPLGLLMYALAHFARYRAFRYRASRTVLRGIRFWVSGSGLRFAALKLTWSILVGLSLGLALPWSWAAEERYRMSHLHWGTLKGDFVGTGKVLFRRAGWIWAYLVFGCGGAVVLSGIFLKDRAATDPLVYAVSIAILLAILPVYPIYLATLSRWRIEGVRIGEARLVCGLKRRAMIRLFVKLMGASLALVVGAIAILAVVVQMSGGAGAVQSGIAAGGVLAACAASVLLLLAMGVVQRYFLMRGFWALVAGSIAVENAQALDEAAAAGQPSGTLGEGLADALDLGGGF